MTSEIAPTIWYPEPELVFHPERTSERDIHPLRGLKRFGPHSRGLVQSPIRVATLAPKGESERLFAFMRELSQSVRPVERTDYLPDWPGFNTVFDMRVTAATKKCRVELDGSFESEMAQSAMPHVLLAEQLVRAIQPLEAFRSDFDVLFIYLPQRWERGF